MIFNGIDFKSKEFIDLCQSHQVNELYVFGSVVNDNFHIKSDIDLIVDINEVDPVKKGLLLLSLLNEFQKHFNRKIDLLTFSSLRNPYLKEVINNTKKLVFDGSKEEVLR